MKTLVTFFICVISLQTLNAQTKITWLGIDFSHVKLIGDFNQFAEAGHKNVAQIQTKYFPSWNMLFINEPEKFDIKKALRKEEVFNDLDMLLQKNQATPSDSFISYNSPQYTQQDIIRFVNEYALEGKEGTGVLLLAESLNKGEEAGVFHFVAIDMKTKTILVQQSFKGKPGGFGIRNYWASAIESVLHQIKKKKFKV